MPNSAQKVIAGRKSRITIDDVARVAGVSITTVSRVVSGRYARIGKDTVQRVKAVVERLHYSPNKLIRSLQEGRSDTIAYASFYSGLRRRDEVQQQTLIEIYCAAQQAGYDVLLPTGGQEADGMPPVSHLLDGRCDGVILEAQRNAAELNILLEQKFPTVLAGSRLAPPGIGNVCGDYVDGTWQAMKYLLNMGHKRIAHLAGPVQLWDEAQCRMDTYLEMLQQSGLPSDRRLVLPNWGTESWAVDEKEVEQSLDYWLSLDQPPTAVFCASDRLAIALMRAADKRGLKIPENLSVIGFDDMPSAGCCSPGLTTVRVSVAAIASAAVAMLRRMIAGETGVEKVVIPAELVKRNSVGSCPKKD